jgi:hypothetical protein
MRIEKDERFHTLQIRNPKSAFRNRVAVGFLPYRASVVNYRLSAFTSMK